MKSPFIQIRHFKNTNHFLDYIISDPIHVSFYTKEKKVQTLILDGIASFEGETDSLLVRLFSRQEPLEQSLARRYGRTTPDGLQSIYSTDWHFRKKM